MVQPSAPIMELATEEVILPVVEIDGYRFGMLSGSRLDLFCQVKIAQIYERLQPIDTVGGLVSLSDLQVHELQLSLTEFCELVLEPEDETVPKAEVLARLSDVQKIEIVRAFPRAQEQVTGVPSGNRQSRRSKKPTAATRKRGGR